MTRRLSVTQPHRNLHYIQYTGDTGSSTSPISIFFASIDLVTQPHCPVHRNPLLLLVVVVTLLDQHQSQHSHQMTIIRKAAASLQIMIIFQILLFGNMKFSLLVSNLSLCDSSLSSASFRLSCFFMAAKGCLEGSVVMMCSSYL